MRMRFTSVHFRDFEGFVEFYGNVHGSFKMSEYKKKMEERGIDIAELEADFFREDVYNRILSYTKAYNIPGVTAWQSR